jgi:hypothetical protein
VTSVKSQSDDPSSIVVKSKRKQQCEIKEKAAHIYSFVENVAGSFYYFLLYVFISSVDDDSYGKVWINIINGSSEWHMECHPTGCS